MNATRSTSPTTTPSINPRDSWPNWTNLPIPFRPAQSRTVAEAEYQREVDRLARTRGGMARLIGPEAD